MLPSERVRARLKAHLEGQKSQRVFAAAFKKSQPWLNKILKGENKLRLDDLDIAAEAMEMPPAELIRRPENDVVEVTPTEMRFLRVFRSVPSSLQDHFLALLEASSLNIYTSDRFRQKYGKAKVIKGSAERHHRSPVSTAPAPDVRAELTDITHRLADLAASLEPATPVVATAREKP